MSLKTKVLTAAAFAALLASTAVQAVTYTVGTGATYRPFEYEAPNKEIVGFDIDLMKAIAKAQGFDVEFVNTTWSTIFPALNNGDRDIIMSGITITDKRKEAVDFSEPYFLAHQLILTSSNLQIKSLKDLEGKLIAVVNASAGDVAASNAFGKASTNIRRFDNTPLALEELANGGVDAMIGDVGVLQWYMKQNPDGKTVAAMDCLVPGIGEIIGGSQREDDYDTLLARMNELGLKPEDYGFYLDLRKYGSTRHAGFGLGFERCVMYLTGISNIRDVLPFPRTVGNCEL